MPLTATLSTFTGISNVAIRRFLSSSLAVLTALYPHSYGQKPPSPGKVSGVQSASLSFDGLRRTYVDYIPPALPPGAPLVLVFHGSGANAQIMRSQTGHEFEVLANADKFVVAYPNAYRGNWNDCRAAAPYLAHTKDVNDVGFAKALIGHFQSIDHINPGKVFAMGYSNGGEMVYRLALQTPKSFRAIAAVAANLPAPSNNDCTLVGEPIPVLTMSGTKDPISPFNGGIESLFGRHPRGAVLSADATTHYFTELDGLGLPPHTSVLSHHSDSGSTSVDVSDYAEAGHDEVAQYVVNGGGHVIPIPEYHGARILGPSTYDVDAPQVIWQFFQHQLQA
jgi:polyhydroxybutyrate depolymerase